MNACMLIHVPWLDPFRTALGCHIQALRFVGPRGVVESHLMCAPLDATVGSELTPTALPGSGVELQLNLCGQSLDSIPGRIMKFAGEAPPRPEHSELCLVTSPFTVRDGQPRRPGLSRV